MSLDFIVELTSRGGRGSTSLHPQHDPHPLSGEGGGASEFGEVLDRSSLPRSLSPKWLWLLVAGFLLAARFEVLL